MTQRGVPGRVLGAPPELVPLPSACCRSHTSWEALSGLPQHCSPYSGKCPSPTDAALAWSTHYCPPQHCTGTSSSVWLAPPLSHAVSSTLLGSALGLPGQLSVSPIYSSGSDPAHGAPTARLQRLPQATTSHRCSSSVPLPCSHCAPDCPDFYFPRRSGEDQLQVPWPTPCQQGLLAGGAQSALFTLG